MGRTARPAALKLINGRGPGVDSGGRKVSEPAPFVRLPPEPPQVLSGEARELWDRCIPELQRLKLTKPLDAEALAAYCLTWQRFVETKRLIDERGMFSTNSQGLVRAPWLVAHEAASKELRAWAQEFGFTPSAEQKVGSGGGQDGKDAEDPFI